MKRYFFYTICLSLLSMLGTACGGKYEETEPLKNIYGNDERIIADTSLHPFKSIGRVDPSCTGFLIGSKLVVTAAHCLVESRTGALRPGVQRFGLDYQDGEPATYANLKNAWIGSFNPEEFRHNDWAIIEIDRPLGGRRQYLSLNNKNFSNTSYPFQVSLVGYQTDFEYGDKPALTPDCAIRKQGDEGRLLFDCDASSGISGGPIMATQEESTTVVAIAVSEFRNGAPTSVRRDAYSDEYANVAIPVANFYDVAKQLLATVDKGLTAPDFDQAFHIRIPDAQTPFVEKVQIALQFDGPFRGAAFRDNQGQINCVRPNSACTGTYDIGTRVTLYAPRMLNSMGYRMFFRYWVCNDANEQFPRGHNLCRTRNRQCEVTVTANLQCAAWFQVGF